MERTADAKAYFNTFGSGDGSTVLDDLIVKYYNVNTYAKGDPYQTTYAEGARSVIHFIQNMVLRGANVEQDTTAAVAADNPLEGQEQE